LTGVYHYPEFKFRNGSLWLVFGAYVLLTAISVIQHELWGDELQPWNLIKGSSDFANLLSNSKYDGHPPVWYALLFVLSKFTHSIAAFQSITFLISCSIAFLLIFYSGFPLTFKILCLAGYYFAFEYAVFGRNYSTAVLIAFLICINIHRNFKFKLPVYYFLLFLLCNAHLLGLILACCFHLYFLVSYWRKEAGIRWLAINILVALVIMAPTACFIFPLEGDVPNISDWFATLRKGQLVIALQAPVKAFMPVPAWWEHHFWNTNAILETIRRGNSFFAHAMLLLVSSGIVGMVVIALRADKKALVFFCLNLVLTMMSAAIFPLVNARYVGFIYVAFLAGLWISQRENSICGFRKGIVYLFLIFQLPGSIIALSRDWNSPFSQLNAVKDLSAMVPPGQPLITDYWGLNYLNAVNDKAWYCVESKKMQSYLVLNEPTIKNMRNTNRYTDGIESYFRKNKLRAVFFLTSTSPEELGRFDTALNKTFSIKLITQKAGAIEKFSNAYLYWITPRGK